MSLGLTPIIKLVSSVARGHVMRDESAQSVISLQINESLIPISPRSVSRDAEPGQVLPRAPITPGATLITGIERG